MDLSKYTNTGNKFFESKLKDYTKLGMDYTTFWRNAYDDFIRFQVGGTDQGWQHCRDVEHNIWKLISKYSEYFPLEVFYVLSLSSALHDCAKTGSENDHAIEGAKIIKDKLVTKGYVHNQATADAVSFIVSDHSSGNFLYLPLTFNVGGDVEVRLKDIAAIFRLADMMSTSEDRAARFYKSIDSKHARLNEFLNSVRLRIQSCEHSKGDRSCIEVIAYADNIDDRKNIESYVKGLNKDITQEHQKILQNIRMIYLKNFARREKEITLPYQFVLSWVPSFLDTLQIDRAKPFVASIEPSNAIHGISRLVPCYFINKETNIDIYKNLLDNIEKGIVDPKYLYWGLKGTHQYLSLCKNPNYSLFDISHDFLSKNFITQICSIIEKSNKKIRHLIDLGIGDGREINIMIDYLISNNAKISLVDFSYHMIRVAVNTIEMANIENEKYRNNVQLFAINGDIRDLHLYKDLLKCSHDSRLFCFFGGTLGNFFEREVLKPIEKEMSNQDFLLLGVNLIGNRSDEKLISAYNSIYNREFLFNPLADVGFELEHCDFKCYVKNDVSVSDVSNSKTIVSSFIAEGKEIKMAISTKYDLENLKEYLKTQFGFCILKDIVNDTGDYAILLLAKLDQ